MSTPALLGGKPVREKPFPAYPQYEEEERSAVLRVIESNVLCSEVGKEVAAFEHAFAEYLGVKHAVAVVNGTTALHVALAACRVGVADEVIVPPYTFIATASAVVNQSAVPIFADIETKSLGLDPLEVEKKVTDRTKAMIPVHMNGYPCDIDALLAIAEKHGITVIEDCSHAHGAWHRGRRCGAMGRIGTFSFQHKKNMSLGEGGIAVTDDDELAERMRGFRSFGGTEMVYNYRMSEFHAAIGVERLKKLDAMNDVRRANAAVLDKGFDGYPFAQALSLRPDCVGVYYNYVLRYDEEAARLPRSEFIRAVEAEGVPLPLVYSPVHRKQVFVRQDAYGHGHPFSHPAYAGKVSYADESHPVSEATCGRVNLEMKVHPPSGEAEMADIVRAFGKIADNIDAVRDHFGRS